MREVGAYSGEENLLEPVEAVGELMLFKEETIVRV